MVKNPSFDQQLYKFGHFAQHYHAVVDQENRNEADENVAERVSHLGRHKIVEQKKEHADHVSDDLVRDVLRVDQRILPLVLCHSKN